MPIIEKNDLINTSNISTKYGIIAGTLMAMYLMIFQFTGNDYSPFLKLFKYLILGGAIVTALVSYKNSFPNKRIFIKGIAIGNKLSAIAAIILVAINIFLFLLSQDMSFSKYGLEPISFSQVIVVSGILFFETFVFGMILTFATLQLLKESIRL